MTNGDFKRGEVYWVGRLGEAKMGVVISSNEDSKVCSWLNLAMITMNPCYKGVRTEVSGKASYISPTAIKSYHRDDVQTFVGLLPEGEMAELDKRLGEVLGFGSVEEKSRKQIDELKFQVLRLKKELQYASDKMENRESEIEKYKRLYEKAVDQIAEMTLAADVARRVAELREPVDPEVEPEEEPEVTEEVNAEDNEEVTEEPEKPLEEKPSTITFPVWEPTPDKPKEKKPVKKVNINTASISELVAIGFSKPAAGKIHAQRVKYGPYKSVEEVKDRDGVTGKDFRKLSGFLEV